jgi:hypothetical protein
MSIVKENEAVITQVSGRLMCHFGQVAWTAKAGVFGEIWSLKGNL